MVAHLFDLTPQGTDTFVGEGFPYPWGGLFGGHIVAQSLRAAAHTVDEGFLPHSLRAYFIRRGDNSETVRYEVDRIRNGNTFCTRRVVARQSNGAILNLEASFQVPEDSPEMPSPRMLDGVPRPADLPPGESWSKHIEQRDVPQEFSDASTRDGAGHLMGWYRFTEDFGNDPILHMCALAYMSDDLPTGAVRYGVQEIRDVLDVEGATFNASLDHTVWFHRPVDANKWHLYEMNGHAYTNSRGLAFGYVFDEDGVHVASVAQETLVRFADR